MKNKKIKILLLIIVLSISCFLPCFVTTNFAYASNIGVVGGYTNVLEDLQKDDTFNADDYPVIQNDYSLQVITIAESSDKELFVYVYQPSAGYKNLSASSVFISTDPRGLDYINYYLTLVSNQGVFYKYRVDRFSVSNETTRDYEITSIYRPFIENIDSSLDNNIINEVPFNVSKHWTFTTSDTGVLISFQNVETIKVTDKYVGFCRYDDGYTGVPGAGLSFHKPGKDSHFIAFRTDRKIDDLLEADVFYVSQEYSWSSSLVGGQKETFGDKVDCYSYLKGEQININIPHGTFGSKYEWETIQTVDEFFETEDRELIYEFGVFDVKKEVKLTDEGKKDIEGMDWVLRFALTDFNDYNTSLGGNSLSSTHIISYSIIGDVSILRLRFVSNGVEYDLGVIDNKQQGDGIPDNYTKTSIELKDEFKIILAILLLIILLVVLSPILPNIINFLSLVIKYIFKVLWWIISAPFKLIGKVFKKRE